MDWYCNIWSWQELLNVYMFVTCSCCLIATRRHAYDSVYHLALFYCLKGVCSADASNVWWTCVWFWIYIPRWTVLFRNSSLVQKATLFMSYPAMFRGWDFSLGPMEFGYSIFYRMSPVVGLGSAVAFAVFRYSFRVEFGCFLLQVATSWCIFRVISCFWFAVFWIGLDDFVGPIIYREEPLLGWRLTKDRKISWVDWCVAVAWILLGNMFGFDLAFSVDLKH